MESKEFQKIKEVLYALSNQVNHFYLMGGTALALCYFHHRESFDLDFFMKDFSEKQIAEVINYLKNMNVETELIGQNLNDKYAKIMMYRIKFTDGIFCKIDFIEDVFPLLKPCIMVEGVNIASLEDIYLRKIYTIAGVKKEQSHTGAEIFIGGRQEAKDFYDLYCLSSIVMPLTSFIHQYGNPTMKEGLIGWFRSYDRMAMKTGLIDLRTSKPPDYREIEQHFQKQVDGLILEEIQ